MAAEASAEAARTLAKALKEQGNGLVREGKKAEALEKYEEGVRLLLQHGRPPDQPLEGRELLSILASNAAQMCMDPAAKRLAKAIELCGLAIEANPSNTKAYFRRAAAAFEHADDAGQGAADALLAQAQADIRRFLEAEPDSPAGKQLQEQLGSKRRQLLGPIHSVEAASEAEAADEAASEPAVEPDWFQQARKRATFVCVCSSEAKGRDQVDLPRSLLSMAKHAKDKTAITLGVAYVGYRGPEELEMFDEEWQKKYYRMLGLAERAVKVPQPRQVVVHGEVYSLWSLLEGRVRVMRVSEARQNGEKVGPGWMRYCAQLLWHGEPFVYQGCRAWYRFAPGWDAVLKDDLSKAVSGASCGKPLLSWTGRWQDDEAWQWISENVDRDGHIHEPPGVVVAEGVDTACRWIRFRRRYFGKCFAGPIPVAFWTPHNSFSTSEVLLEAPADPFANALPFHGQLTCENVRLHTLGWDVFCPRVNVTWEASEDSRRVQPMLSGQWQETQPPGIFDEQKRRADAALDPGDGQLTPLDEQALDLPLPTACFWTAVRRGDPSPWDTGRQVGCRFQKGCQRTVGAFERGAGVDFAKGESSKKAENAGFSGDGDFEDSAAVVEARWKALGVERRIRDAGAGGAPPPSGSDALKAFREGYLEE